MELEELKSAWKVHSRHEEETWNVSRPRLENMMRKKSGRIRQQLIRNMGRDALYMILVNLTFIAFIYYMDLQWKHISALAVLTIMFLLFAHYHIQTLLLQRTGILGTVKEEIIQTLTLVRNYSRMYLWSVPSVIGLVFFGFLTTGIFDRLGWTEIDIDLPWVIGVSLVTGLIVYMVLKAIIKWTVGPATDQLKEILKDLESS